LYRFDFISPTFQDSAMNLSDISATQLRQAASIKEQIERLQKQLANLLGAPAATPAPKKKWKLSAAGLARIKAANKAYWATKKAAKK
jgi:hypothetical protein